MTLILFEHTVKGPGGRKWSVTTLGDEILLVDPQGATVAMPVVVAEAICPSIRAAIRHVRARERDAARDTVT